MSVKRKACVIGIDEHPALRTARVRLPNRQKAIIPAPPVFSRWLGDDLGACSALGRAR